jgi:hypothetical protein
MSENGPDSCLNCFGPLGSPPPRFCPHCGQETVVRPPTLFEFLQQFGGAVLSTEGALWRTLKLLLLRPGELTRQYLAGRRKYYVAPVRLYLTASVVTLLLLRLAYAWAPEPVIRTDKERAERNHMTFHIGSGKAELKEGKVQCQNLPRWLCARIEKRFGGEPAALEREGVELGERFMANLGALMFVLLPTFALFTKVAYLSRHLRYTEHLVFALHLHAFWFIALALTVFSLDLLSALAMLWMCVYAVLAMKRVFGGRRFPLALRAAAISVAYGVTLALGLGLLGVFALFA